MDENQNYVYTPPIVDRIEYGKDWAKGYYKDQIVVQYGGVSDINAIQLYNDDGELVKPVPAPLDDVTTLQLAVAEILEAVL